MTFGVPFQPVPHHVLVSPRSSDEPHQGPSRHATFGCIGTGPIPKKLRVQFPRSVVSAGNSGLIGPGPTQAGSYSGFVDGVVVGATGVCECPGSASEVGAVGDGEGGADPPLNTVSR